MVDTRLQRTARQTFNSIFKLSGYQNSHIEARTTDLTNKCIRYDVELKPFTS